MSTPTITLEEVREDATLATWVELRNLVDSRQPTTLEETRYFNERATDRVTLLARLDGEPVGTGFAQTRTEARESPYGEAIVRVVAERRRRGAGTALLAACSGHLRGLGKTGIQTDTFADEPDALEFLAHRGFEEVSRNQSVRLDLDDFVPSGRPLPEAIELTDLAARPDLLEGIWHVDCEASVDIPGPEPEEPMSLDDFLKMLGKPGMDHRLIVIAVAGDEPVGYALLARYPAAPDSAMHWLTGVKRAWRGRGVAGALKEAQLARARELGIRTVRTRNELRNAPIRRLNDRLGYRPEPEQIVLRGPLTD